MAGHPSLMLMGRDSVPGEQTLPTRSREREKREQRAIQWPNKRFPPSFKRYEAKDVMVDARPIAPGFCIPFAGLHSHKARIHEWHHPSRDGAMGVIWSITLRALGCFAVVVLVRSCVDSAA